MTFRISIFEVLSSLLLLGLVTFSTPVWSASESDRINKSWIRNYETSEIHFPNEDSEWAAATPGRHPFWIHLALNKIFKWDPQDQDPAPQGNCAIPRFVETLIQAQEPDKKTQAFNEYHQNCEDQYVTGSLLPEWQAFRLFSMSYSIDEHPFLHRVVFSLPNGKKLKGMLALKDEKKRPLIILRMGITGNVEEAYAERFFYYQLFERGLFNFLMVENLTGSDYIHNNRSIEFGGLAEAYQNLWLAELFQSKTQPLSKFVESVHLVGLSLGGQGALTSAWLLPHQKNPQSIRSILALCPLVNLGPTFDHLFLSGWKRFGLEFWAHSRFAEVKDFRPELFESFLGLPHRILKAAATEYKKPDAALFGVKEPEFLKKKNEFNFVHELSRWNSFPRAPFWIWVTQRDSIVPVKLNTDTLTGVLPVRINVGDHCSFPSSWDGRMTQAMFRGHILGATQFRPQYKSISLSSDPEEGWDLKNVEHKKDGTMKVTIVSRKNQETSFQMQLSDLDFQFRHPKLTEPEKRMIRRWLSTNLTFAPSSIGSGMTVSWPFVKP